MQRRPVGAASSRDQTSHLLSIDIFRGWKPLLGLFLIPVLLLSACNDGSDDSPAQAALNASRSLWASGGFNNYVFTYSRTCFCPPEEAIVVTVANDAVTDAFFTPSGTALSVDRIASMRTIDEFFDVIQDSLDSSDEKTEVSYNPTFGYPEQIFIDVSTAIADEEIGHNISNFQ